MKKVFYRKLFVLFLVAVSNRGGFSFGFFFFNFNRLYTAVYANSERAVGMSSSLIQIQAIGCFAVIIAAYNVCFSGLRNRIILIIDLKPESVYFYQNLLTDSCLRESKGQTIRFHWPFFLSTKLKKYINNFVWLFTFKKDVNLNMD